MERQAAVDRRWRLRRNGRPAGRSVQGGYIGITTDTGHTGSDGTFGMKSPGVANKDLWVDFAYRSEHLMSVVGKQLAQAFYGKQPELAYWNGCSTGGRQGLMMRRSDLRGLQRHSRGRAGDSLGPFPGRADLAAGRHASRKRRRR